MITHNIGFYEDLTKIIFYLSSNIIKYTLSLLLNHVCVNYSNTHYLNISGLINLFKSPKYSKIQTLD